LRLESFLLPPSPMVLTRLSELLSGTFIHVDTADGSAWNLKDIKVSFRILWTES
jgi:hypothetical protein